MFVVANAVSWDHQEEELILAACCLLFLATCVAGVGEDLGHHEELALRACSRCSFGAELNAAVSLRYILGAGFGGQKSRLGAELEPSTWSQ